MIFNKLLPVMDSGGTVDIVTVIDSSPDNCNHIGQMLLIHTNGRLDGCQLDNFVSEKILDIVRNTVWTKPTTIWIEDQAGGKYRFFWDRIVNKFRAIVLGGGHISQPLVQMLSLLDFEVTVIDDRPEFANQARFPGVYRVICTSFQPVLKDLTVDNDTAIVIVTRGHRYDMDCLRATMRSNARYLGMIGSRRRIREIVNLLQDEGAPEGLERRLRAPIGLDIKAETPAEIAVSIAAEVVSVFRGGSGCPLSGHKEVF
ncbi:XdhC family protein [Sporomusa malonica]|uniref:Xanthine dehydrogenase accessory factor n=1 Tax=Sporomusa malonica TaxID=112901 RepID=A0A1W2EQR1_9FIRM|nr:XdhC family protein [Sporomusa malonica]SMD11586.1 xanthine dehydrogenase accessory factor [Sporomusa malonica]